MSITASKVRNLKNSFVRHSRAHISKSVLQQTLDVSEGKRREPVALKTGVTNHTTPEQYKVFTRRFKSVSMPLGLKVYTVNIL